MVREITAGFNDRVEYKRSLYNLPISHTPSCSRPDLSRHNYLQPLVLLSPGPEISMSRFYRSILRLRQLCVGKRDSILKEEGTSKEAYYACPGKFRVRLQSRLPAWGMDLRAWDAGLRLITAANGLAHPPGEPSDETIRADVACVVDWFCGGGSHGSVLQARLERFANSRPPREQSGAAKPEVTYLTGISTNPCFSQPSHPSYIPHQPSRFGVTSSIPHQKLFSLRLHSPRSEEHTSELQSPA